ncbi:MAG: prepilin-type N-terminal cleavage/methylation domain-containing protein, partial [Kineosporiaceae bacterium]
MTAVPPPRRRRGAAAGQTDAGAAARCGRSDAGFTLVEVVVALVLLSILLASVGVLFVGGLRNSATLQ